MSKITKIFGLMFIFIVLLTAAASLVLGGYVAVSIDKLTDQASQSGDGGRQLAASLVSVLGIILAGFLFIIGIAFFLFFLIARQGYKRRLSGKPNRIYHSLLIGFLLILSVAVSYLALTQSLPELFAFMIIPLSGIVYAALALHDIKNAPAQAEASPSES